jgi:cysteine-rich repeat protein
MWQDSSDTFCMRAAAVLVVLLAACGESDVGPDGGVADSGDVDSGEVSDTDAGEDADADDGPDTGDVDAADGSETGDDTTTLPGCGDGVEQVGEECDDGNVVAGDGCSAICSVERCGDGVVQLASGEECEPALTLGVGCDAIGFATGTLGCDATCRFDVSGCVAAGCGNGVLEASEACDDSGVLDGDGCSAVCLLERCVRGADADGDGTDDCDDSEDCDGIDNNGDGLIDNGVVVATTEIFCDEGEVLGQCRRAVPECRDGAFVCVGGVGPRAELCNGLDDNCDGLVPDDEADCGAIAGADLLDLTDVIVEAPLTERRVDFVLHVDVTTSMAPTLAALRALAIDNAPWRWSPLGADVAWGLVAQADFSLDGATEPHRLLSRVTTSPAALTTALLHLQAVDGGDFPEPWELSLWRVATGGPIVATAAVPAPVATARPLTFGWLNNTQPQREYSFELASSATLVADVLATRVGSSLDTELTLLDEDGAVVAANDDANLLDPALRVSLPAGSYRLLVTPCCGAPAGWFALAVLLDGVAQIGTMETVCTDSAEPIAMRAASSVWPLPAAVCQARCALDGAVPAWLLRSFCGDGLSLGRCGDARLDAGEACDDGNTVAGDGCDARCALEAYTLPAWRGGVGYSAGLGHGLRGGAGFRAGADAFVVHLGDATAVRELGASDFGVVSPIFDEETTLGGALRARGVQAGGVWFGVGDGMADLQALAVETGAWAPACAFDGHPGRLDGACSEGQCCTGIYGSEYRPDEEGRCGLAFEAPSLRDIEATVGETVAMLYEWSTYDVSLELEGNRCLVQSLAIDIETSRCAGGGTATDIDEDGVADTLSGLRRGDVVRARAVVGPQDGRDVDGDGDASELCAADDRAVSVALVTASGDVLTRIELLVDVTE